MNRELDEIYQLYAADVYRYIYSLCRNQDLAGDILQDTMLKAVTEFDKFRGECSVKTWLCSIARNLLYNDRRRRDNRNLHLDDSVTADSSFEEKLEDSDQAMQLHRLIHRLDEPYREIFTLRVFAEMKFADIGEVFGKSENWARVTYFRAKEKIITMMREEEESL